MYRITGVGTILLAVQALLSTAALAQTDVQCASINTTDLQEARLVQAHGLRTAGQSADAAKFVAPLATKNPQTFRIVYYNALVEADLKNWDQAEKSLNDAIALQNKCLRTPGFKPDYTVYNTLGWLQMSQGDVATAKTSFQAALSHSSEMTPASVARTQANLGTLYFSQGDFKNARKLLEQAASAGSESAKVTLNNVMRAEAIYESRAGEKVFETAKK